MRVEQGDNVMIGGFYVGGDQPAKVLIRAIGPSLKGIAHGNSISNDDWRNPQETEIEAIGVPPSDSSESAILAIWCRLATPRSGAEKGGTTGIGLTEAHTLNRRSWTAVTVR